MSLFLSPSLCVTCKLTDETYPQQRTAQDLEEEATHPSSDCPRLLDPGNLAGLVSLQQAEKRTVFNVTTCAMYMASHINFHYYC